jgi:hypothetical protein
MEVKNNFAVRGNDVQQQTAHSGTTSRKGTRNGKPNGDKWHYKWWFNGDFVVEEWMNNGEQWDDMGFTLW